MMATLQLLYGDGKLREEARRRFQISVLAIGKQSGISRRIGYLGML